MIPKKEYLRINGRLYEAIEKNSSFSPFVDESVGEQSSNHPIEKSFFYPLQHNPTDRSISGKRYSLYLQPKKVLKNLIRKAIFKGLTIDEWIVAFYCYEKTAKTGLTESELMWFCAILSLSSTTRMSVNSFKHSLKPLRSKLDKIEPSEVFSKVRSNSLSNEIVQQLKLPSRFEESFSVQEHTYFFTKGKELSRIGIGYKDKGYKKPDHQWLPDIHSYEPSPGVISIEKILDRFFKKYPSLKHI